LDIVHCYHPIFDDSQKETRYDIQYLNLMKSDLESLAKYFHSVAWVGASVDVLVGISTKSFGDPNHFGPNIEVAW
jgi:hypothetical protein